MQLKVLNFIKNWLLIIAIVVGALFNQVFNYIASLSGYILPGLIFMMLLFSLSKIKKYRIEHISLHLILNLTLVVFGVGVYYLLQSFNVDLAQGAFIIAICSAATSSPVIVSLLKGRVDFSASYLFFNTLFFAVVIPFILPLVCAANEVDFEYTFFRITSTVVPTILIPLLLIYLANRFTPKLHLQIQKLSIFSYYILAIALLLLIGRATHNFLESPDKDYLFIGLSIIASAVIYCVLLFIGRRVGVNFGEGISAGQGLAHKNTVLAIWLATSYLNPAAVWVPTAYIVVQNVFNSLLIQRDKVVVGKT